MLNYFILFIIMTSSSLSNRPFSSNRCGHPMISVLHPSAHVCKASSTQVLSGIITVPSFHIIIMTFHYKLKFPSFLLWVLAWNLLNWKLFRFNRNSLRLSNVLQCYGSKRVIILYKYIYTYIYKICNIFLSVPFFMTKVQ